MRHFIARRPGRACVILPAFTVTAGGAPYRLVIDVLSRQLDKLRAKVSHPGVFAALRRAHAHTPVHQEEAR